MGDCSTELVDRLTTPDETGLDATYLVPLLQLLAAGDPVEMTTLAAAAGRTVEGTRAALAKVPDTEYDDQRRIVGQGLTLRRTPHRFTVDGQQLYTWCALDTVIFPLRLTAGPDGVRGVEPATAVVSLVAPDDMTEVRSAFCNQVHFFTSTEDAGSWLEAHPDGEVMPVYDAFLFGARLTTAFLTGRVV